MDFQVKMMPHPDKEIEKAVIKMYDSDGIALDGQFLLEAETAETRLHMPPGGRMEVTEYDRNEVYDTAQFATVPVGTAEREGNVASPNTPRDEARLRQYEDKVNKQILDEQQKNRKDDEKQEGVDARQLRMKEAEEQEKRIAEYRKIPLPGESPEATKLRIEQGEKADKERKEREKFLNELDPKDAEREKQKSEPHKGYSPSAPPPPQPASQSGATQPARPGQPGVPPVPPQPTKPGTPASSKPWASSSSAPTAN